MATWIPTLVHSEHDFALGFAGPVYCVIWRNETTVEGGEKLHAGYNAFRKHSQHGLVTIVEEGAPLPKPEARERIAKFLGDSSDTLVVSAVIFEGSGFRSAAVRGVVTGLTLVARQAYPHRVFGTLDGGAQWFVRHAPDHWDLDEKRFIDSMQGIRAKYPR